MHLKVDRTLHDADSTASVITLDGALFCYGLEDEPRTEKVYGKTRIPAGTYKVAVRNEGGFNLRYANRFPKFHKGMLHITGVPGFEYVLIHCGNTHEHTAGCLLVGEDIDTTHGKMRLSNSTGAYTRLYKAVISAAMSGNLTIEFVDSDIRETV